MQQPNIAAHDPTGFMFLMWQLLQQIGRHHRCNETGDDERKEHCNGNRQTKLLEILPSNTTHERHRREDGDHRKSDRNNGQANFSGRFHRRAVRRFATLHVAGDVFNFHNRIVHQNTRRQSDGEEGHEIEREAKQAHRPEGRKR